MAAFDAAGVKAEDIKTWSDLADAAQKIKAAGYEYGWEPMWGPDNMIDAAFSNGASIFSADGTKVTINSPEWVEVWEAFRTWIHDDKTMAIHSGGQGWELPACSAIAFASCAIVIRIFGFAILYASPVFPLISTDKIALAQSAT